MFTRQNLPMALLAVTAVICLFLIGDEMKQLELPRDQDLPLFDPHIKTFTCSHEMEKAPPLDAQAHAWFLQARALESPEIYVDDRDYRKIVELTRQAAERLHWKAMLNLASLYVEGRDPEHDEYDALLLVEQAMRMGVPAAYDRMGTYYSNGIGVGGDATRAHAFWQRAAQMGNPQAMTFLAEKMNATWDSPKDGFWANIPIATKMFECAWAQGFGQAAFSLHELYLYPRAPNGAPIAAATSETRARALRMLHDGVKLGCIDCARDLYIAFDHPFNLADMIAPHIDVARGERYLILHKALNFNPDLRFPNLDQVLPLPPARISTWNGDKDTLIKAAMGVRPPPAPVKPHPLLQKDGRQALDPAFRLQRGDDSTRDKTAPFAGYWQPKAPDAPAAIQKAAAAMRPALHARGERFDTPFVPGPGSKPISAWLVWEHWLTVYADDDEIRPHSARGLTRIGEHPAPLLACGSTVLCPATGIWQPWVDPTHPMRRIVNVYWRQAWIHEGQAFPRPQHDWLLDLPEDLVTWHLLDTGVDIDRDLDT